MRRVWRNWWMQVVAGLLINAIVVLPWLWIGQEDKSILPHSSDDAQGLLVVFAVVTLWGSWFARTFGYGRTSFTVVTSVGMVLGLLGLGFQGLYALEPELFSGVISAGSTYHLWVFSGLLIISLAWYFLSVKLRLPIAVLFYATLTVGVSYWLQIVASLVAGAQSFYVYLWVLRTTNPRVDSGIRWVLENHESADVGLCSGHPMGDAGNCRKHSPCH